MKSFALVLAALIIAVGLALHGYFSRERRYTAVSNHGTDLTGRILILDKDTGKSCMFNCKGESSGWAGE